MMADLGLAARIAQRELRGGLKGFQVFLACLAIGVAAIAAIGTVRSAIEAGLKTQGAVILGGDVEIQLTYRFADPKERAWMDQQGDVSELVDFRSMIVSETGERALTQIKGVDDLYPLYGKVQLSPDMPLKDLFAGQKRRPGVAIDPVLIDRLGLEIGDTVRIGTKDFALMAALERIPDGAASGFALGPPTLVARETLEGSGLLTPGTLFETEYRIRTEKDPVEIKRRANEALEGSGFRWRDRRNGAPGIAEFVERLSAFLVLVGLTGLAVGGVGVSAAVRAYLTEKTEVIATLRAIGATRRLIFGTYFIQIGILSIAGIAIGLLIGATAPLLLSTLIEAQLPIPAEFAFRARPLVEAALYGGLAALLFTLWPLAQVEDIRAATLFRDARLGSPSWPRPIWMVVSALILSVLVATAALLTGLWALTFWASFGILVAFLVLVLATSGIKALARRYAPRLRSVPEFRFALGAVAGPGRDAHSVVVSLGLGLAVLAAVGQIDWNLRNAIATDLPEVAPSYFVVDIQPDQLDPLKDQLGQRASVSKVETAPMLRGVITEINGQNAISVAGDHWVLRGDRGITYAAKPPEGTLLTEGEWWPKDYNGETQISFAAEEAAEMGLKLGDRLTLNVLGRDIEGRITSFREVDFSTGGIGFILSMNPAALRGAPHTHIATVYSEPSDEGPLLREIAKSYPNITAIRVRDAIERVSGILAGIASAVTYGAMATLLTGMIVLIGTAAAGERQREYEGAILKTLGATRGKVLRNFALRSALLGITAGLVALCVGIIAGWAVSWFVMETDFQIAWASALAIVTGGIFATLLTGTYFAWRPLSARPAQVLRVRE